MKYRPQYYGWYDQRNQVYRLSQSPPDSPRRPSKAYQSLAELMLAAERKRAKVYWWPPLTREQLRPLIPFQSSRGFI